MTVALLFPGQGSQSQGLLQHLPQRSEVTRTIEEARDILGVDIGALDNAGYRRKDVTAERSPTVILGA